MDFRKFCGAGLLFLSLFAWVPIAAFAQAPPSRPVPIRQSAGDVARPGDPRAMQEIEAAALAMPNARDEVYAILDEARARRGDADAALLARQYTLTGRGSHALDWMRDVAFLDGSSDLVILYADTMWAIAGAYRSAPGGEATATMLSESSRAMTLFGLVLIVVDGARCVDKTAANARVFKVMTGREDRLRGFESLSAATRDSIRRVAIGLEIRTATARREDPGVCMDGVNEMQRIMESAGSAQIQRPGAATGHYGTVTAITPGPGYLPDYLTSAQQTEAMAKARPSAEALVRRLVP